MEDDIGMLQVEYEVSTNKHTSINTYLTNNVAYIHTRAHNAYILIQTHRHTDTQTHTQPGLEEKK